MALLQAFCAQHQIGHGRQLHAASTSALDKEPPIPAGPEERSGHCGTEKNFNPFQNSKDAHPVTLLTTGAQRDNGLNQIQKFVPVNIFIHPHNFISRML